MTDRQSTHGHDCWSWGPRHYECAVGQVKRDEALLRQALEALELRCGTNADERKELIPALRERLGEGEQAMTDRYANAAAELTAEIDALRTRLEDTVRDSTNKIEALRTEAEQHLQQAMSNGAKARAAQAQANNLRTEVEALRAEVAEWKRVAAAQAELHGEAEARAEQLADALRIAEEHINALTPEWYSAGQRVLAEIRAALEQENSND